MLNYKLNSAVNAMNVKNISQFKNEEEVIFPSGTEFIIDQIIDPSQLNPYTIIKITIPLFTY
jgi:hypothetical protein